MTAIKMKEFNSIDEFNRYCVEFGIFQENVLDIKIGFVNGELAKIYLVMKWK